MDGGSITATEGESSTLAILDAALSASGRTRTVDWSHTSLVTAVAVTRR